MVSSSVECIIAQRLVRKVCQACKKEVMLGPSILKELGVRGELDPVRAVEGTGCEACKFTGYKGRTAIHEILLMNDALRALVVDRVGANIIRQKAVEHGMGTLRESGWVKIRQGITTPSEVIRVADEGVESES